MKENLSLIVPLLLQWYDSHARSLPWRDDPSPYKVWISEIMLQQTRVEAVKPYFLRWIQAFPDLSALANASEAEVLKLWEGLGYYSRVRNIHRTASLVLEKNDGQLPASFQELRSLPGIGEYTAGSIGSIAFQLPVPCVDGNVLRVITRLTAEKADIGDTVTKKKLTEWVSAIIPVDRPGDFNQALMELGATVCLPNGIPKCEICPVAGLCEAKARERVTEFPVKRGKSPRRIEEKTVLLLLKKTEAAGTADKETATADKETGTADAEADLFSAIDSPFMVALRKRPDTGLLAGLWEFPNFHGTCSEEEVRSHLEFLGLKITCLTKLRKAKHIFTHIEWHMTGYLALCESGSTGDAEAEAEIEAASTIESRSETGPEFQWVEIGHLESQLTLPAAFKTYYQKMKDYLQTETNNTGGPLL